MMVLWYLLLSRVIFAFQQAFQGRISLHFLVFSVILEQEDKTVKQTNKL